MTGLLLPRFRAAVSALLLLLVAVPIAAAADPAIFDEANKLYDAQEFAAARDRYEQLIADGSYTANVFFNLGNTEYRLGHVGKAILAYERALLLDPTHHEASANLNLLRGNAGAKALPPSSIDSLILPLSTSQYGLIAAVAFWLTVFALVALSLWRTARPLLAASSLITLLVTAYAAVALVRDYRHRQGAVVTAPEAVARLEPADRSGVAEALPGGSDVRVLSEHGEWIYCDLPGRGRGWLPRKSIQRIAPGAGSA